MLVLTLVFFYILAFRIKWRDVLTRFLSPLVQRIPPYITPNQISGAGFFLVLLTCLFIYLAKYDFIFFLWGALFMFLYAVVDQFDGILARARGQATKSGTFLDYTLDKFSHQLLLFSLILGKHVRTELVVISMLCSLFYSLINMEALALTGRTFPLMERPRYAVLAIILFVFAFLIKFAGVDELSLGAIKTRSLDLLFPVLPVYLFMIILFRGASLWKELRELDRGKEQL